MTGNETVHVRDDENRTWHASTSAEIKRGAVVFDDARYAETVCGERIPADDVGSWSESEPFGKTARVCPDCTDTEVQTD